MRKNIPHNPLGGTAKGIVFVAQNGNAHLGECGIARLVLLAVLGGGMLPAVKLDHELPLGNVKVYDICPDDLLTVNRDRQAPQEIVPQMLFLGRHIPPQCLRVGGKGFVVRIHLYAPCVFFDGVMAFP